MTASGHGIVEDPLRRSEQRRELSRAHVTGAQCGKGRGVCASGHGDDGARPSAVSATQPHDVSGHNGDGSCERRESAGQRPKSKRCVWSAERPRGCVCCCCLRTSAVECTARCCLKAEGAARGSSSSGDPTRDGNFQARGTSENSRELIAPARSTNAIRQLRC
jgi:hypothetical protein